MVDDVRRVVDGLPPGVDLERLRHAHGAVARDFLAAGAELSQALKPVIA